jgi:hypothetical protein
MTWSSFFATITTTTTTTTTKTTTTKTTTTTTTTTTKLKLYELAGKIHILAHDPCSEKLFSL